MFRIFCVALFLSTFVPGASSSADSLHLVPNVSIVLNADERTASIEFAINNYGDVSAKNVSLSIAQLNEKFQVAGEIAPKGKETLKIATTFDALGLKLPGRYSIPYSIRYHDPNFFPSNVTYVADLRYEKWPSDLLSYGFERLASDNRYSLADTFSESFWLRNQSDQPVEVSKISLVTSSDLERNSIQARTPLTLAPNQKISFEVEIGRTTNSLLGSIYGSFLIIEGEHKGVHFSEPYMFQVQIVEAKVNTQAIIIAAILALIAAFLLSRRLSAKPK